VFKNCNNILTELIQRQKLVADFIQLDTSVETKDSA